MTATYRFDRLLAADGWRSPGFVTIDAEGNIVALPTQPAIGEAVIEVAGHAIPGMPNLHSHAFQRAMAGRAERPGPGGDSFWTWRETIYRFVERVLPDDLEAIAAQLYVEMLEAGFTAVAEFHYLHHAPDGTGYDDPAEMSGRVVAAAKHTGIGLTLLPVLYDAGGFGGAPAGPGQKRFVNDVERFIALVEILTGRCRDDPRRCVGIAPHSLRAVTPDDLESVLAAAAPGIPIHMHVAEQIKEVEDCLAWCNARPIEWLLDHAPVDQHWCLVHATHMTAPEINALAASGAVAGLCPTTEANLGDGFFPLPEYLNAGGVWGIGSDSHVSVSPIEELRWLEYGQRLKFRKRGVAESGSALYRGALAGGARALGQRIGAVETGLRADIVILDGDHPILAGTHGDALLDAFVFSGNASPVRDVMVGGDWVVRDGRHRDREAVAGAYRRVMDRLVNG